MSHWIDQLPSGVRDDILQRAAGDVSEPDLEYLVSVLEAVHQLPSGYERIGRGHIICHQIWYALKLQAADLTFSEAARRYCGGKPKNAAITILYGDHVEHLTLTQESGEELKDACNRNLDQFFKGTYFESIEYRM